VTTEVVIYLKKHQIDKNVHKQLYLPYTVDRLVCTVTWITSISSEQEVDLLW